MPPQPYSPEVLDQLSRLRKLSGIIRLEFAKTNSALSKSGISQSHDIISFIISRVELDLFVLGPRLDDILDSKVPLPEAVPNGANPP